ncbi:hypothetical protein TWF788_004617 [Orbilia oligospora]|uniref:Uncharacterized protein n=1 Tax=Orbilia oligospora TaxID=2813651 RepID=A0A7C8PZM2_ORBOL|nr:hypothetical protein TWF788_004617 [Orbilia oligospora]
MPVDPKLREEYTIGWICALPKEQIAAVPMLDQRHPDPKLYKSPNDTNAYFFGSIGPHNVVITCLPLKCYGTNRTAKAAAQMLNNFPSVKITFMVGIGAGIPTKVKLGDVVVGTEWAQWDFGKANGDGVFEHTGRKCFPPDELLSVMSKIRTEHSLRGCNRIPESIRNLETEYPHLASEYCLRPDTTEKSLSTLDGNPEDIRIHYGLIASGNQVVKDARVRDDINKRLEGQVLCLEMEAAGLVGIPAVVIRGICDYADSNKNDDWQEYAAAVAAACTKEFISSIEPATAREIQIRREDFDRAINEIAILRGNLAGDKERKILEWITPIDDSAQHNDFLNRRQPGTGNWLLNSSEYQNWLHTPKAVLYCPGIPGAGKTILTSVVVDDLFDRYFYDPAVGIAYIYFNFKGSAYLRIDDLLSSLLKQLMRTQDSLPKHIEELYDHYKGIGRPSRAQIMNSIHVISAAYSRMFIVIDALDEYEEYSEFLEKIFEIYERQQLSIFATSRHIPGIRDKFKGKESCTECEIRASDEDVRRYLEGQILRLGTKAVKSNKEIIKNSIVGLVQGMASYRFLLAHLYFEAIKTAKTLKMINQILKGFSSSRGASNSAYDSTYSAIMEKIRTNDEVSVPIAFKVLIWITCASRRLTKKELQHAIAVEPEEPTGIDNDNIPDIEDLISPCLGLVTIDEESNVVRLIHYTAQEYFERTKQYWFSNPHDYLAKTCVIYLSYDSFKSGPCLDINDLKERMSSNALYEYAAINFAYHVQESSPEQLLSLVLHFLLQDNLRLACVQVRFFREAWYLFEETWNTGGMQALHCAAYYGLVRVVEVLLVESWTDLEKEGYEGRTPLLLAAGQGHNDVVELLIKEGANLEAKSWRNRTALWFAVSSRRETVTRLLIDAGADVSGLNLNTLTHIGVNGEALRLLTKRMLDIELREEYPQIACITAKYGHEDTIRRLIEMGADLDAYELGIHGPLWYASEYRQEGVVRLMVDAGVNLERDFGDGKTPIYFALQHGHKGIVEALVKKANLQATDKWGRSPLSIAVDKGDRDCIELLLENGALVTPDALCEAFSNEDENTVKLLLEVMQMQNLDAEDSYGETLLSTAIRYEHESTIKFLIQKGADIQHKNREGKTPLLIAIERAHIEVGRLPVDIEEGESDESALLAVAQRREGVVRLLLENVEYIYEAADLMWDTVLRGRGGGIDIARLLIEKVAGLEDADGRQAALICAAANGNEDIVRALVRAGIGPEVKHKYGITPLIAATRYNHRAIVEFLIVEGASVQAKTEYGRTPLSIAAEYDDLQTPLSLAAENGREGTVRLLVEKGADWRTIDKNGDTPLSLARKINTNPLLSS